MSQSRSGYCKRWRFHGNHLGVEFPPHTFPLLEAWAGPGSLDTTLGIKRAQAPEERMWVRWLPRRGVCGLTPHFVEEVWVQISALTHPGCVTLAE